MAYSPFDKPIDQLTADDLGILIDDQVAEGYWVEYKQYFPDRSKIAHSIASFANTYGGWYFIGIKEEDRVATEICGFSLSACSDPIARVREVIKSHINPVPVFHAKLIKLDGDKAILAAHVPDGQETPFITKDGRIYRRESDSSYPVAETDRYAVDRLVDKGREISRRFEQFCQDERTFSKAEEHQGWLNIYLSPYPLGTIDRWSIVSTKGIEELLQLSQTLLNVSLVDDETGERTTLGSGNCPLDSGQPSLGSVVLRQTGPSSPVFNVLTTEIFVDGRAKFLIPLRHLSFGSIEWEKLKSSQAREALKELLKEPDNLTYGLRFLDVPALWATATNLLNFYVAWLGQDIERIDIRMVMELTGVWRTVPFCDTDHWGEHSIRYGLPVLHQDHIKIPRSTSRSPLVDPQQDPPWVAVCGMLLLCLGLPLSFEHDVIEVLSRQLQSPQAGQ